jgi:hypothetical protein
MPTVSRAGQGKNGIAENQQKTETVGSEQVGALDQGQVGLLGIAEGRPRETAQQKGTKKLQGHPEDRQGPYRRQAEPFTATTGRPGGRTEKKGEIGHQQQIDHHRKQRMKPAKGGHDNVEPVEHQAKKSDAGSKTAAERPLFHDHEQRHQSEPCNAGQVRPGERESQQQPGTEGRDQQGIGEPPRQTHQALSSP